MIVIDTSVIVAYMNGTDANHRVARDWIDVVPDDLVTTPLILAEVDHLLITRGGRPAAQAFRRDLADGGYLVDWWPGAIATTITVAGQYADLELGLADASLVALADRHNTADIATFDHRHFRAVRPLHRAGAFRLLPSDAA